jgi:hypothetical protein
LWARSLTLCKFAKRPALFPSRKVKAERWAANRVASISKRLARCWAAVLVRFIGLPPCRWFHTIQPQKHQKTFKNRLFWHK